LPEAKQILAEEEAKLATIPNPRRDMPVWVSTAKGMIALIENDAPAASQNFRDALTQAQGLPMFDESARLTLKQRLGFSYIRLGDGVKAEQAFRELIQDFTRVAGSDSPNVLRVRLNLAQAYMIQNKHTEAVAEANAIYPQFVTRLGEDHELTMQLLTTRAQSEGSLGLWNDAYRDDMTIYRIALRKQGPMSFFSVVTLSDAALAQCRGGHIAEGEINARRAYEAARKGFGDESAIAGGTAYTVAACLIDLGRLPEAAGLLENIDSSKVAQLAGIADWGANVDLAQAEIAYRRKNYAAAKKYLESATPAFTRPGAEVYQRQKLETLSAALEKAPISN
jgi:tetratricopeptide (TPR) repeat protein